MSAEIDEVAHNTQEVSTSVESTSTSIVEVIQNQQRECGEILKAIEEVRSVTVQNIDAFGRVGHAVENLMKQSVPLEREFSRFKLERNANGDQLPELPDTNRDPSG